MKRIALLLAVLFMFAFTAVAQEPATSSTGQTSTTTKHKKAKSTSSDSSSMASESSSTKSASGKTSQLTGCISQSANSEGNYTLTNGKYKKAVELIPAEGTDVSKHAGHEVRLSGKWTTEAAEGKNEKSEANEKYAKHFQVASIKHLADTCPAASAKAGTEGHGDMGASTSTTATTTKGKHKKVGNTMAGSSTATNPK